MLELKSPHWDLAGFWCPKFFDFRAGFRSEVSPRLSWAPLSPARRVGHDIRPRDLILGDFLFGERVSGIGPIRIRPRRVPPRAPVAGSGFGPGRWRRIPALGPGHRVPVHGFRRRISAPGLGSGRIPFPGLASGYRLRVSSPDPAAGSRSRILSPDFVAGFCCRIL